VVNRLNTPQQGVGLLEVLITVLVLSIGLLGMAALQARGQQAEMESYQRAQALILLEDMANRMNANREFRDCYNLGEDFVGSNSGFVATGCNGQSDDDLTAWDGLLRGAAETLDGNDVGAMIGARGCIILLADRLFEITVAWQGLSPTVVPADNTCAEGLYGDDAQRRVVTRVVRFAKLD
jgi:type IV pilus assembly protein PilV